MLDAQIGLARVGSFFKPFLGAFPVALVTIAAVTAATWSCLLPSTAGLARSLFAAPHELPRSFRSLAQ
jgi:hypothetical protein